MKEGYTIAIGSDFHSNATACREWIRVIKKQEVDEVWLLGDYVSDYPNPQETLDQLYALSSELPTTWIRGNREEYFLSGGKHWKPSSKNGSLYHTMKRLRPSDLAFFDTLPITTTVAHEDHLFLLAHGAPNDCCKHLYADSQEVLDILQHMQEHFLITGHTHTPSLTYHQDRCFLNPGSIGVSICSTKGEYATLTYENNTWKPQLHTFVYSCLEEQRRILSSNFLKEANYWGVAAWLNLQKGNDSFFQLLKEAYQLSNHKEPQESDFIQAAKNLHFPTMEDITKQTKKLTTL